MRKHGTPRKPHGNDTETPETRGNLRAADGKQPPDARHPAPKTGVLAAISTTTPRFRQPPRKHSRVVLASRKMVATVRCDSSQLDSSGCLSNASRCPVYEFPAKLRPTAPIPAPPRTRPGYAAVLYVPTGKMQDNRRWRERVPALVQCAPGLVFDQSGTSWILRRYPVQRCLAKLRRTADIPCPPSLYELPSEESTRGKATERRLAR